jgi:hypothetical protein
MFCPYRLWRSCLCEQKAKFLVLSLAMYIKPSKTGNVMLCYVMLCYVMLCYVMLCYVMLCYVMLCYVMLCYVRLG